MKELTLLFASVAAVFVSAAPARAEIVFLSSGRTLSVRSHRTEGVLLVLVLRNGGEIVLDRSFVARITPDEVPYPEPEEVQVRLKADTTDTQAADESGGVRLEPDPVPYSDIIDQVSAEQGVSPRLVRAVIQVESAYRHSARSPKGAMGLMQLMPATARQYGVANPYDPASNIEGGIKHLKSLLQRFTVPLALAAYNAGEAAVERFGGIPPYRETRHYVSTILKLVG